MPAFEGDRSKLYDRVSTHQRRAGYLSIVTAFVALIVVIAWMNGTDRDEAYLGGFNTNELLFNYHPVFMTLGMLFCGLSAMLTYRIIPMPKLSFTKPLHGTLHTAGIIFIVVGLYAVFEGNNDKSKNEYDSYFSNLWSMHSLVGLSAAIVYGANYFLGLSFFALNCFSDDSKRAYMPLHTFAGLLALVLVFMAVETGIMDLSRELGCDVHVSEKNLDPASTYHRLQEGCRVGNGAGVLVMATALLGLFAMYDFRARNSEQSQSDDKAAYLLDGDRNSRA